MINTKEYLLQLQETPGVISATQEAAVARSRGQIPAVTRLEALKQDNWDIHDKPAVVDYAAYRAYLDTLPDYTKFPELLQWWEVPNVEQYFSANQGNAPACAGFAAATAYTITTWNQKLNWEPLVPSKINPMVTWAISKGGSVRGGQSMHAIALACNETGNYPADYVGEYQAGSGYDTAWRKYDADAAKRQFGFAEIPYAGDQLAEEILYLCKKRRAVIFGATGYISSWLNGDGVVSSCGAHAQCFGGYYTAGGKDYVVYLNSWGNYADHGLPMPRFGGPLSLDMLKRFCRVIFDPIVITYAETPLMEVA